MLKRKYGTKALRSEADRLKSIMNQTLCTLRNGCLTVIVQDGYAIQMNINETYKLQECLCEDTFTPGGEGHA